MPLVFSRWCTFQHASGTWWPFPPARLHRTSNQRAGARRDRRLATGDIAPCRAGRARPLSPGRGWISRYSSSSRPAERTKADTGAPELNFKQHSVGQLPKILPIKRPPDIRRSIITRFCQLSCRDPLFATEWRCGPGDGGASGTRTEHPCSLIGTDQRGSLAKSGKKSSPGNTVSFASRGRPEVVLAGQPSTHAATRWRCGGYMQRRR